MACVVSDTTWILFYLFHCAWSVFFFFPLGTFNTLLLIFCTCYLAPWWEGFIWILITFCWAVWVFIFFIIFGIFPHILCSFISDSRLMFVELITVFLQSLVLYIYVHFSLQYCLDIIYYHFFKFTSLLFLFCLP